MDTIIKTDACKADGNATIKDEFNILFDSSFWEEMEPFPPKGNERFLSLSHLEFASGNLNFKQNRIRPSDTLHCQDPTGSEILIPAAELKVYATQHTQHSWGIRFTIFFLHTTSGATFYLEDNASDYHGTLKYMEHEFVIDEPLFALPLDGSAGKVIDQDSVCYHNLRWFKLQGLNTDKGW